MSEQTAKYIPIRVQTYKRTNIKLQTELLSGSTQVDAKDLVMLRSSQFARHSAELLKQKCSETVFPSRHAHNHVMTKSEATLRHMRVAMLRGNLEGVGHFNMSRF